MRLFCSFLLILSYTLSASKIEALEFHLVNGQPVQGSMVVGKVIGEGDVHFNNRILKKTDD